MQWAGPQDVLQLELRQMDALTNTSGYMEATKLFTEILNYTTYDGKSTPSPFTTGKCVLYFTLAMEEIPLSPATFVGSPVVHNRRTGVDGILVACDATLCPSAVERADGLRINPARPVISRMGHAAIDRRSNRKDWGWSWLKYMQSDDVWFSLALQGKATPMTTSQFDATKWHAFIDTRMPALLADGLLPDNTTALQLASSLRSKSMQEAQAYLSNRYTLISSATIDVSNIVGNPFRQMLFVDHVYTTQLACLTQPYNPAFGSTFCGQILLGNTHGFWDTGSMGTPSALSVLCGADPLTTCGYNQAAHQWIVGDFSFGAGLTFDAAKLATQLRAVDRGLLEEAIISDGYTRALGVLPSPNDTLLVSEARSPYLQKLLRQFRQPIRPSADGTCGVGYQATAEDAPYCMPCPKATHYDLESPTKCTLCAVGKYQDSEGALVCATCPNPTIFTTMGTGASSRDDCTVPSLALSPSYPNSHTTNVRWELFGYDVVQTSRYAELAIGVELIWDDDRLATFETPTSGLLTEVKWRELGLWLPSLTISNFLATSSMSSNFLRVERSTASGGVLSATVTWTIAYKPATVRFPDLRWDMFPYGTHELLVELRCLGDTACVGVSDGRLLPSATTGDSQNNTAAPNSTAGAHDPSSPALNGFLVTQFSQSMPDDSWEEVSRAYSITGQGRRSSFSLSLVLKRAATLYLLRIIIPTIFCVVITVFVFFTQDVYNQLICSFTAILILSVVAVEVHLPQPG